MPLIVGIKVRAYLLVVLAFLLTACSPVVSATPQPTFDMAGTVTTAATSPVTEHPAVTATSPVAERPTVTATRFWPTLTPTPSPQPTLTVDQAVVRWGSSRPQFIAVELSRFASGPEGGRGHFECGIEMYEPPMRGPVFSIANEGASYQEPAFSPDREWMAYVEITVQDQARLRLASTDGQMDGPLTEWMDASFVAVAYPTDLQWSPSGNWLAFEFSNWQHTKAEVYTVNVATGEMRRVGENAPTFAWSRQDPTSLVLAMVTEEEGLGLYLTPADGSVAPIKVIPLESNGLPRVMAWQPRGSLLAVCFPDAWLYDMSSPNPHLAYENRRSCDGLVWSPDGRQLALLGGEDGFIFDSLQGKVVQVSPLGNAWDWVDHDLLLFIEEEKEHDVPKGFAILAKSIESGEEGILWRTDDVNLGSGIGVPSPNIGWIYWSSAPPEK